MRKTKASQSPARHVRFHALAFIYIMFAMVTLLALASMGVDYGHVQLTKTELQRAADAAARFATTGITNGTSFTKASTVAAENNADGTPVALLAADVRVGNWSATSTPKFSTTRTPLNAVEVTAKRTAERGTAVRLMFTSLLGINTCDVHAVSIAKINLGLISGFIGLSGFSAKNNLFAGGYDSSVTTSPTQATATLTGMVGSNTSITAKNNEDVNQVVLGPSGTHNLTLTNTPITLTTDIPTPTINFSAAPATNPNGVSQTLSVNGQVTLAAGTYYFTSVSIANNSTLSFSGPATVYVNGNVSLDGHSTINAYNQTPANLVIRQKGSGTTFGGANALDVEITADMEGPQSSFYVKHNAVIYGRAVFNQMTALNNFELYYDQQLGATIPGTSSGGVGNSIALVQ